MSLDDLQRLGFLRPEEQWSEANSGSTAPVAAILPLIVVGVGGCVAIGVGDGGWVTWLGVAAFLAALLGFTVVNDRAIGRDGPGPDRS